MGEEDLTPDISIVLMFSSTYTLHVLQFHWYCLGAARMSPGSGALVTGAVAGEALAVGGMVSEAVSEPRQLTSDVS